MTWSINFVARTKASAKDAVQQEAHCPQAIKDVLCGAIDSLSLPEGKALFVESNGYLDSYSGCNITLRLSPYGRIVG